jgi:azurin
MKKSAFALSALLMAGAPFVQADECAFTLNSTDSMQFDQKAITVKSSCKEFTLNLVHTGKLPKNVMGHNWVLTKSDNHYVKAGDERVIAFTPLIGGGETTSVTFAVDKLKAGEAYTYFCSFPGHISLMQGTLTLE